MTADAAPAVVELDQVVETAESEAIEADGLVEALEERVLAGEPEVTATEFEQAQGLAKFARKRAEGARQRKAAAEAAQLAAATAGLVERFEAATATRSAVHSEGQQKFEAAVEKAARDWMKAASMCDRQIREVVTEANSLDIPRYEVGEPQRAGPCKGHDRVVIAGHPDLIVGDASRQVVRFLKSAEFVDKFVSECVARAERDSGVSA